MEKGYIKIYRKTEEDPLYFMEPFTKYQAWFDLILLANYKDNSFIVKNGEIINLKRGQCGYSLKALSDRWKWSRGKVRRFITYLTNEKRIYTEEASNRVIITILNYDKYQSSTVNDTLNNHLNGNLNGHKQERKEIDILLHKISKSEKFSKILNQEWVTLIEKWLNYKKAKKQTYKTEQSLIAFIEKLLKLSSNNLEIATQIIDESMANNWNGIFELKQNTKQTYREEQTEYVYNPNL